MDVWFRTLVGGPAAQQERIAGVYYDSIAASPSMLPYFLGCVRTKPCQERPGACSTMSPSHADLQKSVSSVESVARLGKSLEFEPASDSW